MKTTIPKEEEIERKWYVVDAEGVPTGRLAVKIATVLRGKNKPIFTPHVDTGDFVIVINADKVKFTGNKEEQKLYQRHTGWPGGFREINAAGVRERKPEMIITKAVKGMIPRTRQGRKVLTRLKVFAGTEHTHSAQQPEVLEV